MMFGSPETTPGGRALKFFPSVRLDIRCISQIKDNSGKFLGNRTRVKLVKNQVATPLTECEFDIMCDEDISKTGSVIDLDLEYNILDKKGSWISFNGKMIGQGRESAKQSLQKDVNFVFLVFVISVLSPRWLGHRLISLKDCSSCSYVCHVN
jgi:recombination protein RecA